jgi:hypothetical protein
VTRLPQADCHLFSLFLIALLMATVCLQTFSYLVTWRNLAILLALLNLKNLPLGWHFRLLFHALRNLRDIRSLPRFARSTPSIHPLFATHTIRTRTPLLETDYNLHKSNSTYFTDLDISRTGLVFSLLSPGFKSGNAELEAQGHKGRFVVVLGSVHASFRREIQPYEQYEVRSRLLGWDEKWMVIVSWFVRPARGKKGAEVLASALSKYVVKKGRFTVSPERSFRHAGLLPKRPADKSNGEAGVGMEESQWEEDVATGHENGHADMNGHAVGVTAIAAPDALGKVVDLDPTAALAGPQSGEPKANVKATEWNWDQIEMERLRGLELANGWLALDGELLQEFSRVPGGD